MTAKISAHIDDLKVRAFGYRLIIARLDAELQEQLKLGAGSTTLKAIAQDISVAKLNERAVEGEIARLTQAVAA